MIDINNNKNFRVPVQFFKNDKIRFENNALEELQLLLKLTDTINDIKSSDSNFFDEADADLMKVAITPDFHKGTGIPIGTVMLTQGFVIPQAIGNDVNCGMRLYTTDLGEDQILSKFDKPHRP